MKGKRMTAFQFRWATAIHERAERVAAANHRSMNAQILYWLENGGIPADLLDEAKADIAEGLEAGK